MSTKGENNIKQRGQLVKATEKRPLGRPSRRWEDNIRKDLKGLGVSTKNWVDSAWDRDYWRAFLNAVLNFRVPQDLELVNSVYRKEIFRKAQAQMGGHYQIGS